MGRSSKERERRSKERGRAATMSTKERESDRRCNRERERVAAMSAVSGEQRERASSRREWRKKKNDENLWSLDLESGTT
jgi:hypothetical protein